MNLCVNVILMKSSQKMVEGTHLQSKNFTTRYYHNKLLASDIMHSSLS